MSCRLILPIQFGDFFRNTLIKPYTMKKLSFLFVFLFATMLLQAQTPETHRRALGFYLSPGLGDFDVSGGHKSIKPSFTANLGYRFINKLKGGFFLEGGVGLGFYRGYGAVENGVWYSWDNYYYFRIDHPYTYRDETTELNWSVPFLVGYKSQKGKVRFQGALGIAFNLKIIENYDREILSGDNPDYYYYGDYYHNNGNEATFGTGFSAMARAGISIPVKDWVCVDILPTARYKMFYFTKDNLDLTQSITNLTRPWSVGLDVGVIFSLKDKEQDPPYHTDKQRQLDISYTSQMGDTAQTEQYAPKVSDDGPWNMAYIEFAGNGMLYTMNYERKVFQKGNVNIHVRGGMGFTMQKYAFPLGANIALGAARKKFEAGLTCTLNNFNRNHYGYIDRDENSFNMSIDPSIAFRLESRTHLFFRLAVMTHYFPITGGISPGAGVSVGGWF